MSWNEIDIDLNRIRLHVLEAGRGPVIVLLHGFPEFSYAWRKQIDALAAKGFRVLAPDLRGYNLSARPARLSDYTLAEVALDIGALIRWSGGSPVNLVGHDWGGLVAWAVTILEPELVDRLIVLNTPHPSALSSARREPRQVLKFWYQAFFQIPWIPETSLRLFHYLALRNAMRKLTCAPMTDEELERYLAAWAQPGALKAMLNYYRALYRCRSGLPSGAQKVVQTETLFIWGEQERFFMPELVEQQRKWAPHMRVERVAEAGHFVHLDAPERVTELILSAVTGGH